MRKIFLTFFICLFAYFAEASVIVPTDTTHLLRIKSRQYQKVKYLPSRTPVFVEYGENKQFVRGRIVKITDTHITILGRRKGGLLEARELHTIRVADIKTLKNNRWWFFRLLGICFISYFLFLGFVALIVGVVFAVTGWITDALLTALSGILVLSLGIFGISRLRSKKFKHIESEFKTVKVIIIE
jgi:hypothetical protein